MIKKYYKSDTSQRQRDIWKNDPSHCQYCYYYFLHYYNYPRGPREYGEEIHAVSKRDDAVVALNVKLD